MDKISHLAEDLGLQLLDLLLKSSVASLDTTALRGGHLDCHLQAKNYQNNHNEWTLEYLREELTLS